MFSFIVFMDIASCFLDEISLPVFGAFSYLCRSALEGMEAQQSVCLGALPDPSTTSLKGCI
jgi:hypothetical protein